MGSSWLRQWTRWCKLTTADQVLTPSRIKEVAAAMRQSPDSRLAEQVQALRRQAPSPEQTLLTFATAFEAARRVLSIELYDVQLEAGLALGRGEIVQMQTGEGKTFTAIAPAAALAIRGGVHVMTVNGYLAERDYALLAPVYALMGLRARLVGREMSVDEKRAAYAADITYGEGCEFGFDFLRDQSAEFAAKQQPLGVEFRRRLRGHLNAVSRLQRSHAAAIVDEADSVMIDEATTPLVLAGSQPHAVDAKIYTFAQQIADRLRVDQHFRLDTQHSEVEWSLEGRKLLEATANDLHIGQLQRPWLQYVKQALRAKHLFLRDVHYVVNDDQILLVDQQTGRIVPDRSWQDGLHQAVQVKEAVSLTAETFSLARITRQRYFSLYGHLCGMTGTTYGSESELKKVYHLKVRIIPTHRPSQRTAFPLRVFPSLASKERAIAEDVRVRQQRGQPVLVGTPTIAASRRLSERFVSFGLDHTVLNGDQDAEEADLVARAGHRGAVTIATNMAGRGTDIVLGEGVAELGGLHVIVTEPQESQRATRQLVGRSARQGNPGSCQCFASAEDPWFAENAPSLVVACRQASQRELLDTSRVERAIHAAQASCERRKAKQREDMFRHDQWLQQAKKDLG